MSSLTEIHTYEIMSDAIISGVSSESTGQPAEHAITPLEPDFAWETDEVTTQHTLTVDLGEIKVADGFSFIHHSPESATDGVDITCLASADGVSWTAVDTSYNSDGTDTDPDLLDDEIQIKVRHFVVSGNPSKMASRYWKFTLEGVLTPFYPPTNTRISMCWLFNLHQIDKGSAFPLNDTIHYPKNSTPLAFGRTYRTGFNVNPHVLFTRTWMLNPVEYGVLYDVMRVCNGSHLPFLLIESDGVRRLCRFEKDTTKETIIDTGIRNVECSLLWIPTIKKNRYH